MLYKLILSLLLIASSHYAASQQTGKKEVDLRIGLGLYTHPFFKEANLNQVSPFEWLRIFGKPGIEGTGARTVSASMDINDEMEGGISFLYQRIHVNYSLYNIEYRLDHFALLPHLNYRFLRRPDGSLYSGLGLGPALSRRSIQQEVHTVTKLAYQATFLGFRYGKKYALVMELGYGNKGIVNVLFSAKL